MRLENWSVVVKYDSPYQAPELGTHHLHGRVYGSFTFKDGEEITTSPILRINDQNELITYSGSHYTLGEIDPEYEKLYPGAKERLIKSLRG